MSAVTVFSGDDTKLIRLARDLAIQLRTPDEIREAYKMTHAEFDALLTNPHFIDILTSERTAWLSANNTHERVKIKAATLVEEWLPELYERMNDPREPLNAKIEAGKLAARLAGMGLTNAQVEGVREKFSININIGTDSTLKVEKEVRPLEIDYEDS